MKLIKRKKFKELVKNLENYTNEDGVMNNDDHGVDYYWNIQAKDFGYDDEDKFWLDMASTLEEEELYGYCNEREGYVYVSSADEIFVDHLGKEVYLPAYTISKGKDEEGKAVGYTHCASTVTCADELHLYCIIEQWMEESGIDPSVWDMDSYGNPYQLKKWDESFKKIEKEDRDFIVKAHEFKLHVEENTTEWYELPAFISKIIPNYLKKILDEAEPEIFKVEADELGFIELEVALNQGTKSYRKKNLKESEEIDIKLQAIEDDYAAILVGTPDKTGEVIFTLRFKTTLNSTAISYMKNLMESDLGLVGRLV